MLLFARNLVRGRTGRAFLAIRENERAAEAMGVNLAQYKTIAFAVSALYTGLAGALSAFLVGFLDPQEFSFFSPSSSSPSSSSAASPPCSAPCWARGS